jgi:hypothetical protein
VLDGKVATEIVNGRHFCQEQDLPAIAAIFGLQKAVA